MAQKPQTNAQSPTKQIAGFLEKFDPSIAKRIKATRAALCKQFPGAIELVYDNYNFLVFGFCSTPRASDSFVSLAANSKGLILSFYYGASLPDPHKILLGSGSQNRFIRLEGAAELARPEVQELLSAAVANGKHPLDETGSGYTVIQSISARQRPRR